jgi:hypothetical protein
VPGAPRTARAHPLTVKAGPNDAKLWAEMIDPLHAAGVDDPQRLARALVAIVRRERAKNGARSWGPGDEVPRDMNQVTDLDGDLWIRQPVEPGVMSDQWKMAGFNPNEHELAAGDVHETPGLLDEYGPVTEVKR